METPAWRRDVQPAGQWASQSAFMPSGLQAGRQEWFQGDHGKGGHNRGERDCKKKCTPLLPHDLFSTAWPDLGTPTEIFVLNTRALPLHSSEFSVLTDPKECKNAHLAPACQSAPNGQARHRLPSGQARQPGADRLMGRPGTDRPMGQPGTQRLMGRSGTLA